MTSPDLLRAQLTGPGRAVRSSCGSRTSVACRCRCSRTDTPRWDDPAATVAMIAPGGWLRTGDLGTLRDGYLFMASRHADLILCGGENVYPAEVEAVLDEHPAVVECAAFGVDDPDLGQSVAAVVVGDGLDVDALRAFATARLAYYKVPAHWRLTSEPLLRTATGKVVRRALAL